MKQVDALLISCGILIVDINACIYLYGCQHLDNLVVHVLTRKILYFCIWEQLAQIYAVLIFDGYEYDAVKIVKALQQTK